MDAELLDSVFIYIWVHVSMCACRCVCICMRVCVCVCIHLMGLGRDLDKRLQVLSGNKYLSLMKSNKKQKKRKAKNIIHLLILLDLPLSFRYWAYSPSNWENMTGSCLKTFWLTFLFWEPLWLFTSFSWALKSSRWPFPSYLSPRYHSESFSCFANLYHPLWILVTKGWSATSIHVSRIRHDLQLKTFSRTGSQFDSVSLIIQWLLSKCRRLTKICRWPLLVCLCFI